MTHLDDLVLACRELLEHRTEAGAVEAELVARRDAAVVGMVTVDGIPQTQVALAADRGLRAAGLSDEEIRGLGISYPAVRKALRKAREGPA